jgi:hypothetical protein
MNKKILALVFIIFISVNTIHAQNNYATVDIDEPTDYSELAEFFSDSILDKYKVYFTGENHQYAYVNSELEFKLLVFLNQTQGVNHFVFEQSPATGYIITQAVLDNEDISYKLHLRDKFFDPFYNLVKQIKKYNDTIPENKKISVEGIDVERFPSFSLYALHKITDSLSTEGSTGIVYETIDAIYTSEFKDGSPDEIYNDGGTRFNLLGDKINAWETIQTIMELSKLYKDKLKEEIGEDYNTYVEILQALQAGHDWYQAERSGDMTAPFIRERFMIDQFLRVYHRNPHSKYYGQFGRCHLHAKKDSKKCYSHNMQSIASRINSTSDSTLQGKVLTIPVYYKTSKTQDVRIIEALELDYRFNKKNKIYLIDLDYLEEDNPIAGFEEDLPYVIVNTYMPKGFDDMYAFNLTLKEYHLGAYYGYTYFNKINKLNYALNDIGAIGFTNKITTYSFAIDYITMKDKGIYLAYTYYPSVSNGDRFKLKGSSFTYGSNYPFGNKYFMSAFGINLTYGRMTLIEDNTGTIPNLIQLNSKNITVYKNDIFLISPNFDFRITLPVVSLNAKVGYNFDVSGKYWQLDGKMKDFTKTSFSSPYIQIGASFNFKQEN